jgi:hypothetical protein
MKTSAKHPTKHKTFSKTGDVDEYTKRRVLSTISGKTSADPVRAQDLALWFGIKDTHKTFPKTRKLIRQLQLEGHPICSGSQGFFMPSTDEELEAYVRSLYHRADAIHERILAIVSNHLRVRA